MTIQMQPDLSYRILSETEPGKHYRVPHDFSFCTCRGWRPLRPCKHVDMCREFHHVRETRLAILSGVHQNKNEHELISAHLALEEAARHCASL